MNQSVNLFEGDIYQLITKLQKLPVSNSYLKFAGETSLKDMLNKMHNGCPILAAEYTAQQQSKPFAATTKTTYEFSTEGQLFDVATYLAGEPEYWLNEVQTAGYTTARDLYINISIPSNVMKAKIFEKLIKVIEIIDQMESEGQRLNVILYACSKDGIRPKYTFTVTIKQASEPVNIDQLIYLVSTPAVMRYAKLWMQDNHPKLKNYSPETDAAKERELLNNEDLFYIPSIYYDMVEGHGSTYKNIDLIELYNLK